MMPTLIFVNLTYLTTGILQVHGYFMRSAAISIPFNLLIILALYMRGDDIVFLSYVTTIGWLLQFLIQVPVLKREKYVLPRFIRHGGQAFVSLRQLVPVLLGNSLLQLCLILDRTFATNLGEGSTAALSFGGNLFVTITSVFIVAMSTVVFPRLSKYCLDEDFDSIRALLATIFKILLFILVPYLILVVVYNQEIISLVYERGAFTSESTRMTSQAFLFYSFAVIGYACQEIFNRVFYALKKFRLPMIVSLICLAVNIAGNQLLVGYGIAGVSISTAAALLLYAIIMFVLIHRNIGGFAYREVLVYGVKLLIPVAGMLGVIIGFKYLGAAGLIMAFLLPLMLSGLVYLALAYICQLIQVFTKKEVA